MLVFHRGSCILDDFTGSWIGLYLSLWLSLEVAIESFSTKKHILQQVVPLPTFFAPVFNSLKTMCEASVLLEMQTNRLLFGIFLTLLGVLKNLISMHSDDFTGSCIYLLIIRNFHQEVFWKYACPPASECTMPFFGACGSRSQGIRMKGLFLA